MFSIGKLSSVKATPPKATDKIKLFTPDMAHFEAISRVAEYPHSYLYDNCKFDPSPISDGEIYRDEALSVEALHNLHLGDTQVHRSFSYRIRVKDKTILYTGDVDSIADIEAFLAAYAPQAASDYVVVAGDTVGKIAVKFGVDWKELAQFNKLANPDLIYVGQTLKIPQ
jgi:LysM repeat protein